jgi:type I restriction enzyme S subunit
MSSGISSTKEQAGHGSPFLSFSVTFNNYFVPDELTDLMATSDKEKEIYSIKSGDIFLTRTSEVVDELAMSCVAIKDYAGASYSGFLKRLRPTQTGIAYSKFMAFYLRSPMFRKTMTNNAVMTLRASLNEAIFSYLYLLLPDFDDQITAGDLLYLLNEKIELNNRISAELEAMAKILYDYWFVQFDFPDANGKPYKTSGGKMVYNPTLKREIPEGWEVNELSEVTSAIRRGVSPKYTEEGGISVLNQKCVREHRISFEDARRHQAEIRTDDDRLLKIFDVVVNSTGVGTLGRVAFVKRLLEEKTTVDSHVSIVRADREKISPQYLAWTMIRYQPIIEAAANGSTGQVELSKSFLENINVVIPAEKITFGFENLANPIVHEMATREEENERLIDLRDWLLPMLMNGQVTVI